MDTLADLSPRELLVRRLKIAAFQTRRLVEWQTRPASFPRPIRADGALPHVLHAARVPLISLQPSHPIFEAGKRHNVALAAPAFHGLVLRPDRPFSFWRTLGRVTESAGYQHGMELAGGCIVPAIGGGLCLLARGLFQAALQADLVIVERHGHSMIAVEPPAGTTWGLDATLAWPHVDLRFAPRAGEVRLDVRVRDGALVIRITGTQPPAGRVALRAVGEREVVLADGRVRMNRIERTVVDGGGAVLRRELVAENRSRVRPDAARERSCLTCEATDCRARVEVRA